VAMAYKNAKKLVHYSGLGKLVLVNRKSPHGAAIRRLGASIKILAQARGEVPSCQSSQRLDFGQRSRRRLGVWKGDGFSLPFCFVV